MTFPQTPLDLTAELFIDGAWTDVTSSVRGGEKVVITRGRSGEGSEVERSRCGATIDNRTGDFSPRNPTGQYYGLIGRNTPMRVRLGSSRAYLLTPTGEGDPNDPAVGGVTAPDSVGLSITGDIDIRVEIERDTWGTAAVLANKYLTTGDQRSWAFAIDGSDQLNFRWSSLGTLAAIIEKSSTAAVTVPASGRLALRVTLDVDNGAAGNTVTFYTASSISGSWTQLGAPVVTAGTTSIFNSTADVEVAGPLSLSGFFEAVKGRTHGFEVYQNIAGTLRGSIDITDATAVTATSFTDAQGNTWTLQPGTFIINPGIRFTGEVSEWPQRWDPTGTDVHTPIEASGILRRLTQGNLPLKSTLYRGLTSLTNLPKAYWPCEDGTDATELASALGGPPMVISGAPSLASHTGFTCSAPLPTLNDSEWSGAVPSYSGTGDIQLWFLCQVPTGGAVDAQALVSLFTTGTVQRFDLIYHTGGGDLRLKATAADGSTSLDTGAIDFNIDGDLARISLELSQNGANIDWAINIYEVGSDVVGGDSGSFAGSVSGATRVVVNPGGGHDDVAIGHIAVSDEIRDLFDLANELDAYAGEAAGRRIERLCEEEGIAFRCVNDLDATATMGPQLQGDLVSLLREAAEADGGILFEPRDFYGLAYRTREGLYNQVARLALDYSAADLSGIEPTDDDQHARNDITVRRIGGGSYRAIQSSGPLSIQAPPDGIGRYDTEVSLSLDADTTLPDRAGWLLFLGTLDEARYPVLALNLARSNFTANSGALGLDAEELDIGDRLTVVNPPAWLPPDDITQQAQGFTETMANFEHTIEINCSPESPWGRVAVYDDPAELTRYSPDEGAVTLNEDLTDVETAVDVAIASGPLFSHADGDFDIRVGGEVMTVTAVAGASSPQTLTVTRSVVKTHSTGAAVELDQGRVYAI